jgi:hypothetical protein
MLEEKVVNSTPRFHFMAEKQNDVSSIVVEMNDGINRRPGIDARQAFAQLFGIAGNISFGQQYAVRERLARINARAPIYTVIHGDIDLSQLFNTSGFMLRYRRQHQFWSAICGPRSPPATGRW